MRLLNSLYSKLALSLLVLFCLTGLFFIGFTLVSTQMYQNEINQKLNRNLADSIVAEHRLLQDGKINQQGLKDLFHSLMIINPSIELYLINPEGVILAYSAPPGKVKLDRVDLGPVHAWFDEDAMLPILGDDPRNPGRKKAIAVGRMPAHGPLEGYLYVILASESYENSIQKVKGSYILRMGIWIILIGIFVAVASGFFLFRVLTRRLRNLTSAMNDLNLDQPDNRPGIPEQEEAHITDEIDRLGLTFDRMVKQISRQMDDIKQADRNRRDLIANVSHDLRTPIAALKGYIETLLLQDTAMMPEERKTYLETANNHCLRLTKLVDDLFELAKLDSREASPRFEPMNLRDLSQDVVMNFYLMAESNKVTLKAEADESLPTVMADISMIERALENLIENAIHHTPEGGAVSLIIKNLGGKVQVKVTDTGIGIPENEIPHLFKRFYKVDKSRRQRPGHSGLGLAITHRIIELHHGSLTVKSVVGQGTTFKFTLMEDFSELED